MNNRLKILFVLIAILHCSCGSSFRQIKPYGDTANIRINNKSSSSYELLAVDQSGLLVISPADHYQKTTKAQARIYSIPSEKISKIEIEGYVNKGWVVPVIIFQVIPAILLSIAASSAGAEIAPIGYIILFGPPALSLILFSSSTQPQPGYQEPINFQKLEDLKKYARFPQGLSKEQLAALLKQYGQEHSLSLE